MSDGLGKRLQRLLRAIPIDIIAFFVIALLVVVSHESVVRHGLSLNDPAWYFHFGGRTLDGDVPYRDYVFNGGPLPIYVDAGFQSLFGRTLVASLYASIFVKIARIFVIWLIARRIASARAAACVCLYCVVDVSFGWIQVCSGTPYSQLLYSLAGLFLLLASRATGRLVLFYVALAGFSAGFIVSARQATAVMTALFLIPISALMLYRGEFFTRQRFAALWGGFVAGVLVVLGCLALLDTLGPAVEQMFLDAPEKKSLGGINLMLDPIAGGMLSVPGRSWWGGLLSFLTLPILFVALSVRAATHSHAAPGRAVGMVAVVAFLIVGLIVRDAALDLESLVPRTLLLFVIVVTVLDPDRSVKWFGVVPIVVIGVVALPLASDWANELSYPGPGWGELTGLTLGVVLFVLASTRLSSHAKTSLCACFAAMGLLHVAVAVHRDRNPFTRPDATDNTLSGNHVASPHPMLRGIWITEGRKASLDWLARHVRPGTTCFVYGNLVAIYDFLGCTNPTRIDTTLTDFLTAEDAAEAIAVLDKEPPEFLLAQDAHFTNPALEQDLGPDAEYSPLNPRASRILHNGLRRLLARYELVGLVRDAIGPALHDELAASWDGLSQTRLFRRKAAASP